MIEFLQNGGTFMQRRKPFVYVSNLRDLGGYTTESGNITKYEKIFRSSAIYKLTNEEEKYFEDIGVKAAIDLRMPEEIERHPSAFFDSKKIKYFNFPLSNAWPSLEDEVPNTYFNIIKDHKSMSNIMKTIANTDGGVVFHCTAGKDRTGIVASLLLLLAGVVEEDIFADYMITYAYIYKGVRIMHEEDPDLPAFVGTIKVEHLEKTIERLNDIYGNVEGYLKEIGLTNEEVKKLKNKLF